jgi:hypothetical protein
MHRARWTNLWLNWLPWRYVVRRVARARGFVDPIAVLARLHRFAQPAEVAAPLELLRAGVVFHARGLMNTGAIQHNLDWVWPYWVERQFDPHDAAFIPRAFSITHVNLTHRNWTAVGIPDLDLLPLVDPHGLVTPHWDGWSLDGWILGEGGAHLVPSQLRHVEQHLDWELDEQLAVITEARHDGLTLRSRVELVLEDATPVCCLRLTGFAPSAAWLAVALRPYNPEGVSFIHDVALDESQRMWTVDDEQVVTFSAPADRQRMSTYRAGDVFQRLPAPGDAASVSDEVGMCTAAVLFALEPGAPREITVRVPLTPASTPTSTAPPRQSYISWRDVLGGPGSSPASLAVRSPLQDAGNGADGTRSVVAAGTGRCQLRIPDRKYQYLWEAALRTLVLHSPCDVYPGPYTYKRFWFRDAAFIIQALLCVGLMDRARRALDRFPPRQSRQGYFLSQEGEWDSNGEALWIMHRWWQLCGMRSAECGVPNQEAAIGRPAPHYALRAWQAAIRHGGRWIERKLLPGKLKAIHAGLFPAGFSAEHLGPNDFYYWDNFWGVAGLRSAAEMLGACSDQHPAESFRRTADRLMASIERSLEASAAVREHPGIPASPYRRMDTGAVGSLVAGYPLQLWPADDPRLLATAEFLIERCFFEGGFFQDMIHSGINAYLTLHVAQVLLRAGDLRCHDLLRTVADLASPTGQWPEAIHPRTHGGCMGDGQHVWAAAEWVLMLRNCFVREESGRLILASGVLPAWLEQPEAIVLGPTPTPYGPVSVTVHRHDDGIDVEWQGQWFAGPPPIEVHLPGHKPRSPGPGVTQVRYGTNGNNRRRADSSSGEAYSLIS